MISNDLVKKIIDEFPLIDEFKKDGKITKVGKYFQGICPKCKASATIINENGLFKCLISTCKAEGNVIDYIKYKNNISYRKAIEVFIKRNPKLKKTSAFETNVSKTAITDVKRKKIIEINREIQNFFVNQLAFSRANDARNYLMKKRNLSLSTISDFGIGFVSNCDELINKLLKKYDKDLIMQTGVFSLKGRDLKGKLWNRITFPITDEWNNIISFGGRVIDNSTPKYINGADSPIYNKRCHLYSLGKALENSDTRKLDNIIVCEGYMDVISMHQNGFTNCVASLGTALTMQQCHLLKDYTDVVYTAYDSDAAGVEASKKAGAILISAGLIVRRIDLSPYKDPDEFIKAKGRKALIERINKAKLIKQ